MSRNSTRSAFVLGSRSSSITHRHQDPGKPRFLGRFLHPSRHHPSGKCIEIMATRGDVAAARENIIANGEDPELRNASAKFVVVGAVTVLLCCDWAFATVLAMPLQVALVGYGSYMTGETSFRPRLTPPQQVRDEKATDL
eukprot:TRINITY_DN2492_c0_g1_i3.p2 TRINITY_DN2492_c0_g1~~TRINITY_DN2492_c0_g1_i3.p2  ORF type:complete len:140 (-),score=6.60 TRINITY_DN2492_c0_g1_i3:99-518(-)